MYGYPNNTDENEPNSKRPVNFERLNLNFVSQLILTRYREGKEWKRSTTKTKITTQMKPLNLMQTQIGWDNLLQGKLAKGWRIYMDKFQETKSNGYR